MTSPKPLSSRERVLQVLNFQVPDRTPRDLGGMRSTSISAFAYPALVAALGLPPRRTRVEDTGQMLALPDLDVLDALEIDVVTILDGITNAFDQPEQWHDYDFNGRLSARVRYPWKFEDLEDGTILQGNARMVTGSTVFDEPHAGQPLILSGELPRLDLKEYRRLMEASVIRDEQVAEISALCRRVRLSTDRAIFFNDGNVQIPIGIDGYGGLAVFPVLCITEPEHVKEQHEIALERSLQNVQKLLPEIREDIDVIMMAADDWGTQNNLIASPRVFRELFLPYYRRLNDECHRLAPNVKLFLHCCGAVFDLIDLVVESGFDILNPVQWPAGGHSYKEWKDKSRGRIALWGGSVDAQHTLPLGSVEEVRKEAAEVVRYLSQDGGYVLCNIHNILAEIAPEKVLALYQAAG